MRWLLPSRQQLQQRLQLQQPVLQLRLSGSQARKALKALKGLVRLQARVRGQIVRRQVITNLKSLPHTEKTQSQLVHEVRVPTVDGSCKENEKQFLSLKEELEEKKLKELADLLEEKNMSLAAIQAAHESEINNLGLELEKERDKLANIQLKLQEELKLNESFQQELNLSKVDKDKKMEMNKIRDELNVKISEVRRLQIELTRRENAETDDIADGLKRVIATLEKENY